MYMHMIQHTGYMNIHYKYILYSMSDQEIILKTTLTLESLIFNNMYVYMNQTCLFIFVVHVFGSGFFVVSRTVWWRS